MQRVKLGVRLVAVFLLLFLPAHSASAQTQTEDGDINIQSFVPGPPPTDPPTIDSPVTNDTFQHKRITVRGSCIVGLIVKVFRNDLFAGAAICQSNGTYQMEIDLFRGRNDLVARQYNSLNQASPPSNMVTVFFEEPEGAPPAPTPPPVGGQPRPPTTGTKTPVQLAILYDYTQLGVAADRQFRFPVHVVGGTLPYAISIAWGDEQTSVFSRSNSTVFNTYHTYKKAGIYIVKVHAADASGQQAFLQFALIVSGQPEPTRVPTIFGREMRQEWWPLLVISGITVTAVGFAAGWWFGHRARKVR